MQLGCRSNGEFIMEVVTQTTTTKKTVTTSVTQSSKTVNKRQINNQKHRRQLKKSKTKHSNLTTRKSRVASGVRAAWSEDAMKSAIEAVRQSRMGLNKAAKHFSVPKATLQRHVKGLNKRSQEGKKQLGRSQDLPDEIEHDLVSHILLMESRFYGLTRSSVLKLAYQIAVRNNVATRFSHDKQAAGKEWLSGFLKRNPAVALRIPEATSLARAAGFNRQRVSGFFKLLQNVVADEKLSPSRIYNMDETGFTAVQKPQKVFAQKGKHQVGAITSLERGRNVTFVCCVSATGHYVPPMIIYPRKRLKPELTEGAPAGSVFKCQEKGWINTELFAAWLEHFISIVHPSLDEKVLLILDGHVSHTQNIAALSRAREVGILMLSLPPHCTHRLQPLDLTLFKPLSTFYNQAVDSWMRANPGIPVGEQRITRFFGEAYNKAASVATAVNGFKAAGIWPVDPSVISDNDFAPSDVTERPLVTEQSVEQPHDSMSDIEPSGEADISASSDRGIHETNDISSCSTAETEPVKAASLCPVPVHARAVSNRQSTLGATILTSSPYKRSLDEKLKKKKGSKPTENKAHGQNNQRRNQTITQNEGKPRTTSVQRQPAVQPNTMMKADKPVKVKKSIDKQVPRSGVIKPPKPVESRNLFPRKPTWLKQRTNLGGLL